MIQVLHNMDYYEILKHTNLTKLELKRVREDLIQVLPLLKDFNQTDYMNLFELAREQSCHHINLQQ